MKIAVLIIQICFLYVFYYAGCFIQQILHLPIPGSIIGMLLLFILLELKIVKARWISHGANLLLSYLALLFVPATVGIIQYLSFFSGKGMLSIMIVIISTILVMLSSGFLAQKISMEEEQKTPEQQRSIEL